jgi:hypothetical protein
MHPDSSLSGIMRQPSDNAGTGVFGAAACLAALCLLYSLASFKLSSLDTGYHVAYGECFLDYGRIVDRDPFLYPQNAVPFVNANWGSQVVMAMVHRAAGAGGLINLRLILLAIVFACIAVAVRHIASGRQSSSALSHWTAWAWMLAALAGYERFSMRPELFSYAAMAGVLVVLMRGVRSWRSILVLGVLQVLWVNLHSYFLVGILLTGSWLAGELLRWLWTRKVGPSGLEASRCVRLLSLALLVQIAACFANPWHVHGAIFPLKTLQFLQNQDVMGVAAGDSSGSAWSEISEFQSPFSFSGQIINARTIHAYYVLLGVAAVGFTLLLARGQLGPAIAVLILFAMSIQMRRNIAQFAFVASPLAVGAIAGYLGSLTDKGRFKTPRRYLKSGLSIAAIVLAAWWIQTIWTGRFYYVERRITREPGSGYHERMYLRAAAEWLAKQDQLKPQLFVDYFSSSNVLLWLPERFKLFVDTNTFAVKDETLRLAFDVGLGKTPHNEFFDRYGVNVVLLHCGPDTQTLVRNLAKDDGQWAQVYFDEAAVIFVRRIPEHVPVILANQITPDVIAGKTAHWITESHGPLGRYSQTLFLGTVINVPMSLGWWEQAAELANCAVHQAPDYFEAWEYLGVCRGNLGNTAAKAGNYDQAKREWTRAVECFKKVLDLRPGHQEAAKHMDATKQRLTMLREMQKAPANGPAVNP